jgi:hypothetical protein
MGQAGCLVLGAAGSSLPATPRSRAAHLRRAHLQRQLRHHCGAAGERKGGDLRAAQRGVHRHGRPRRRQQLAHQVQLRLQQLPLGRRQVGPRGGVAQRAKHRRVGGGDGAHGRVAPARDNRGGRAGVGRGCMGTRRGGELTRCRAEARVSWPPQAQPGGSSPSCPQHRSAAQAAPEQRAPAATHPAMCTSVPAASAQAPSRACAATTWLYVASEGGTPAACARAGGRAGEEAAVRPAGGLRGRRQRCRRACMCCSPQAAALLRPSPARLGRPQARRPRQPPRTCMSCHSCRTAWGRSAARWPAISVL